jgi:hypothetical protein
MRHPFEVGETYRNEKGDYEVVSIDGPMMVIRWTDGSTWEGSVALQARILDRIQREKRQRRLREEQRARRRSTSRSAPRGLEFAGLSDSDFQVGVTGTTWRRRESLGGLLGQRLSDLTPVEFQSYAVPRRAAVHVARVGHYNHENKWRQPKFFLDLDPDAAHYGFFIEKSDRAMDDTWCWPRLLDALATDKGLQETVFAAMQEHGLDWRPYHSQAEGLLARVGAAEGGLKWTGPDGAQMEMDWAGFVEWLRGLDPDNWCNLYLATDMAKAEAIASGQGLAYKTVEVYRALLPLYAAAIGK